MRLKYHNVKSTVYISTNVGLKIKEQPTEEQIRHLYDIMKEAIEENIDLQEVIAEEQFERTQTIENNEYILYMEYITRGLVDSRVCYIPETWDEPASKDVEFDDIEEPNTSDIKNYIKSYFEKYEPVQDLTLLDVDVYCGNFNLIDQE